MDVILLAPRFSFSFLLFFSKTAAPSRCWIARGFASRERVTEVNETKAESRVARRNNTRAKSILFAEASHKNCLPRLFALSIIFLPVYYSRVHFFSAILLFMSPLRARVFATAKCHLRYFILAASRPSGSFLRLSFLRSLLCRVVVYSERWDRQGRFSSRHDDECRNVRLGARNSMVCSLMGARTHRIRYILYTCRIAQKHGFTRFRLPQPLSRCFSRENARTLDLFALHFVRFSSRKSALLVRTAHGFLSENLHVFRLESAGVV